MDKTLPKTMISVLLSMLLISCGGSDSDGKKITFSDRDDESPDPVVVEIPIAYIKRPTPELNAQPIDLREPTAFHPGAQLYVRSRASSSAVELNISDQISAIVATELDIDAAELAIDIKDLETSFDGSTLIFSARVVPEPVDNNLEDTTWNIWEYNFDSNTASYLIDSAAIRNEAAADGSSQDIGPHFLPDDRIVFSSTRQTSNLIRSAAEGRPAFIAADESGRGPSSTLHIYDPDDGSFEQISFNPSHDIDPTVISTGEIVFTRWDNSPGNNRWSLYKINPSGRQLSLLYGYHSHDTGGSNEPDSGEANSIIQFTQARESKEGHLISLLRPTESETLGGNIVTIDFAGFVEHDQPVWQNQGSGGEAQTSLTTTEIIINDPLSPGGQFAAAYPLSDGSNRMLISWSQCRTIEQDLSDPLLLDSDPNNDPEVIILPCSIAQENAMPAPVVYGLWIYDPIEDTQLPIIAPERGFYYSEIVAFESRSFPGVPNDESPDIFNTRLIDSQATGEGFGLLRIDSVYDFDGQDDSELDGIGDVDVGIAARANPANDAYKNRPARFVRLVKPVSLPDPDNDDFDIDSIVFGRSSGQGLREIIGYAPIEPDGSVTVKIPANIPFAISILDVNGRRISERHDNWMQLAEGEVRHCTGCHSSESERPHGRIDSNPNSANPGAQSIIVGSGSGIGFANTKVDRSDYPIDFLDGGDIGQTMAAIFDLQRPLDDMQNSKEDVSRILQLSNFKYDDEWTDILNGQVADVSLNYSYDEEWSSYPTTTNSQAPYVNRIVINYPDHIQPIWERNREFLVAGNPVEIEPGVIASNCLACHRSNSDDSESAETDIPAGQLDLGRHIDDRFYRSYRELFFSDTERWQDVSGAVSDRIRDCTVDREDGMGGIETVAVADPRPAIIPSVMNTSGANRSNSFFSCFEQDNNCGVFDQQETASINCTEDGTVFVDPIAYNHKGWLTDGELRLISEWLDIGAQYYNNPFHPDLSE